MEKLELKHIDNFTMYTVDTNGDVFSERRFGSKGGKLKKFIVKGYYRVSLWREGVLFQKQVHRLVAETFIPNNENKPCVNHIDGNKLNNHVNNLEWCTVAENTQHAFRTGLAKSTRKGLFGYESTNGIEVIQLDKSRIEVSRYGSIRDASRLTGISASSISLNINGKLKRAGGFVWKK